MLGPFHFCQMHCDGCDVPRQDGEIPQTDFGRKVPNDMLLQQDGTSAFLYCSSGRTSWVVPWD